MEGKKAWGAAKNQIYYSKLKIFLEAEINHHYLPDPPLVPLPKVNNKNLQWYSIDFPLQQAHYWNKIEHKTENSQWNSVIPFE